MRYKVLLAAVLLVALAAHSQAATVTYGGSVPLTTTNWISAVSIPLFDPSWGTLQSVDFVLGGYIEGGIMFESLDAAPQTVTTELAGEISLTRPDNSILLVAKPLVVSSNAVSEFDGTIDFGGASGMVFPTLTNSSIEMTTSPPPMSDLALFTGVGNITLPVWASGASQATSGANLLVVFNTKASADVRVTYNYAPVPEPSSFILALTSLAGIAGFRKMRIG